jgi:hypothetical protein
VSADITRRAVGRSEGLSRRLERIVEVLSLTEEELLASTGRCGRRHCPVCATPASRVRRLEARAAEEELSPEHAIQLEAARTGRVHIDRDTIAGFLDGLEHPAFFLDFEAFSEAVPTLDGVAPWEHVPVVYSLHRVDHPGAPPAHAVYAAAPGEDGRQALYRDLLRRLGDRGSVVVYGKGFERRMLERLAAAETDAHGGPDGPIQSVVSRLVDLSALFARCAYYDPAQGGSASLKAVYRAIVGDEYGNLEVADGRDANVLYYFLRYGFPEGHDARPEIVLESLERYCSLDTEAMLRIVEKLRSVV